MRAQIRLIPFVVWRMLIHSMLVGLGMSFFDVLFNFFLVSQGYATDTIGLLSTVARIAGLITGIPIGRFIDKVGARRALIAAVVLYVIALIVVIFAPNRLVLMSGQFLVGCAFAMLFAAMFPLLSLVTPHAQQPTVFGFNEAALNMVGLVGSIIAGWLPSVLAPLLQVDDQSTMAYRIALLIGIMVFFSAVLPLLGDMPYAVDTHDANNVPLVAAPARKTSRIVLYGLAGFLIGMGSGTFFPFQSLFLRTQFALSDAQVGTFLSFGGVALGIGAILAGHYMGQRDLRIWSSVFRILAAPALLCLLAPVIWVAMIGFVLRAMLIGASIALNDVLTMRLVNPQQRGSASSIMNMAWAAGWAITSTLSGYMQTSYGFTPLIILGAIAYVLSGLSIWLFQREDA